MEDKLNIKFYNNVKRIITKPFKLVFNPKINYVTHLPEKPYILVGNHKSIWDIPLVAISTDDNIHFMAKKRFLIINYFVKYFLLLEYIQ